MGTSVDRFIRQLQTSSDAVHRVTLRWCVALVWLASGLGAKVLGLVPRHREIVARVLGDEHALAWTRLIGVAEIGVAVWVLSRLWPRWCAGAQIAAVVAMNVLELTFAPDLLLFGRWNAAFALAFVAAVAIVGFGERTRPGGAPPALEPAP
jgi:hypothetical protein